MSIASSNCGLMMFDDGLLLLLIVCLIFSASCLHDAGTCDVRLRRMLYSRVRHYVLARSTTTVL